MVDRSDGGSVSRRDFLRVGGLSVVGLTVAERRALALSRRRADRRSCILLLMTGGPSQLDTFDPKPEAPSEIRGPSRAIQTALPGVHLAEGLPRLAERAGKFSLIRSLYHEAAPIHETGLQLLQTGRLVRPNLEPPSIGSIAAGVLGPRGRTAPYVVLPDLLGETGVCASRGQSAGSLGERSDPVVAACGERGRRRYGDPLQAAEVVAAEGESETMRQAYGETRFGRLCLQARQLVEAGVRFVTVNLFDTLAGEVTFDSHGRKPHSPANVYDYRDRLCPQFDRAVSGLLDDLDQRGMLDDTLVVAAGEFGRTPRINDAGGRDHWPGAFSALVAGGGTRGGQVIGATDERAAAPVERPVELPTLAASILYSLGVPLEEEVTVVRNEREQSFPAAAEKPLAELSA